MSIRSSIKKVLPKRLFEALAPTYHLLKALFWNIVYGFPGRGLKVIGVTGTNGKTTTTYLIHHMLVEAGYNAGLMTTVAYGVGHDIKNQIHHYTNVPIRELMQRLKAMRRRGMDWLVLETTSQALAQHRTWGVPYSVAVMTNVTHEHLDYHKTFERYVEAKKLLFKRAERNKNGLQIGIANGDDPNGLAFARETSHSMVYGLNSGDVQAKDVDLGSDSISYKAVADDETYQITSNLVGSFNVSNTLAAVCVGRALGLSKEQIEQGIVSLPGVEGRMTTISEGQDYSVIVDYAHTPDSFEKLFADMRPVIKGKMIVMFGSAGRRDETKRAVQGRIAGEFADEVIITEEDNRDIDGDEIMQQIAGGAKEAGKVEGENLFLVGDRAEAIAFAVGRANSAEDTVLLLGKGHEKTIEQADGEHPWDEIGTAKQAVQSKQRQD